MTNVIPGPFTHHEHTGPQVDDDPGFVAKITLFDLHGDEVTIEWQGRDEIHIDTRTFTYLSFSEEELYQIIDFMRESTERYDKWKRSKAGKTWLKRNDL